MPLYEYQCNECGEEFEQIVSFSKADVMPVCPRCKQGNTRKKISTTASFTSGSDGSVISSSASCGSGGFT